MTEQEAIQKGYRKRFVHQRNRIENSYPSSSSRIPKKSHISTYRKWYVKGASVARTDVVGGLTASNPSEGN